MWLWTGERLRKPDFVAVTIQSDLSEDFYMRSFLLSVKGYISVLPYNFVPNNFSTKRRLRLFVLLI